MNRDQKAQVVQEIAGQLQSAEAVFAVDYRGISVSQAAELRARLRDADATFRIVKNSLTQRAADEAGTAELKELLDGPTALTLVAGDPALAAKALNDVSRALNLLEFKGGLMDGNTLSADEIRSIARLPSRDVLHGQLVGTIAAPLSGLVRTLNALIGGLASQLQQVAEQGLVSGEAPAGSEGAEADEPAAAEAAEPEAAAEPAAAAQPAAAEAAPAAEAGGSESPSEGEDEPPSEGERESPSPSEGEPASDTVPETATEASEQPDQAEAETESDEPQEES